MDNGATVGCSNCHADNDYASFAVCTAQALLAVMAFSTPDFGPTGKVVYAGVTYLLLMTAYTAINLPYSSLGAVMTADGYERASLNTYRFICAFAGQLVVAGLALTMARQLGGGDDASRLCGFVQDLLGHLHHRLGVEAIDAKGIVRPYLIQRQTGSDNYRGAEQQRLERGNAESLIG